MNFEVANELKKLFAKLTLLAIIMMPCAVFGEWSTVTDHIPPTVFKSNATEYKQNGAPSLKRSGNNISEYSAPLQTDEPSAGTTPESATENFNRLVAAMEADVQQVYSNRTGEASSKVDQEKQGLPKGATFNFDVSMHQQDWIFNVPTVTMKPQDWYFDLPTVGSQEASFDVPDGLEVSHHKVFGVDVPDIRVKTKRVIFNAPSITTQRQHVSLNVPEFGMNQVKWVMNIPEFKLVSANAQYADQAAKSSEDITNTMSVELKSDLQALKAKYAPKFQQLGGALIKETQEKLTAQANIGIASMNGAIEAINTQIKSIPDQQRPQYQAQLQTWIDNRAALVSDYKKQMDTVNSTIQSMIDKVLASLDQVSS